MGILERARSSAAVHRATFLHGFLLPFALIAATVRDAQLRGPYLRLVLVRSAIVALLGAAAIANGNISSARKGKSPPSGIVVSTSKGPEGKKKPHPVHVHLPGIKVDIDPDHDQANASVLGQQVPVSTGNDEPPPQLPPPSGLARSWAWLLALVAFLSAAEGVIVFFSRRWDDWLSFHASRLAMVRPEDETPKEPRIAFDLKWLYRKGKRRIRGYVVFAAGVPALLPLRLVPTVGGWLFTIALSLWGWYWLGVFTASKSAHAWADEGIAPSPLPIRHLAQRVSSGRLVTPLRLYARLWARLTKGVNPAAATFERSPAAFLGLALARVFLSLPGLYLLARPIVPVAAGRLCAESDPQNRFAMGPPVPLLPK